MLSSRVFIKVSYSTMEYDLVLGTIIRIESENSHLKVNDVVIAYLTWSDDGMSKDTIDTTDTMDTISVFETNIIRFTNHKYITPCILPILKYGCIAIKLLERYVQPSRIVLYSTFNIYHCIKSILPYDIKWYDISKININSLNKKTLIIIITPTQWYYTYNNKHYFIDLNNTSLLKFFGKETINNMIKYIEAHSFKTSIYYIQVKDVLSLKASSSRFFNIVDYTQNLSL